MSNSDEARRARERELRRIQRKRAKEPPLRRPVHAAGAVDPLFVIGRASSCGVIRRTGVAFRFGNEGGWVIDRAELEDIVDEARVDQCLPPLRWSIFELQWPVIAWAAIVGRP